MTVRLFLCTFLIMLLCITACKKDETNDLLTKENNLELALEKLSTPQEKNFFDLAIILFD